MGNETDMADEIDATTERIEAELGFIVAKACQKAAAIPKGKPGECFFCGETFARVVEVTDPQTGERVDSCGRCRDKRGIA